jgi:hypothetical protein
VKRLVNYQISVTSLPIVQDYLIEKKEYLEDSLKITFKVYVMNRHADIVRLFDSPELAEAIQCSVILKKYVVTTGMVETAHGYQNTIGFAFKGTKQAITEYPGEQYQPKLGEDQYVARLIFELKGFDKVYRATFVANRLEIVPKPDREQIAKECIRGLKKLLAESPRIFVQSAKTKFSCGILDFLSGRYRAVPHNVYYATYDLIRSLSIWSGMQVPRKFHDKKAQQRLIEILDLLVSGKHKQFKSSKGRVNTFQSLEKSRYEHLVTDLYEMRQLADYEMHFEMGEFLPRLSNLMLRVEELFTLASYIQDGSMATHNGKIVLVLYGNRELEPLEGSDYFDWLSRQISFTAKSKQYNIMEKGLILAEKFDVKKLQTALLRRDDIYFSPYTPLQGNYDFYFKFEKDNEGIWRYSGIIEEKGEMPKEEGYILFDVDNIKKVSNIVKADEIDRLNKTDDFDNEICICDGKYFFVLTVLSDGRFYYFSPLAKQDVAEQIVAMAKIREIITRIVSSLWEYQSTVSFSPFSVIP